MRVLVVTAVPAEADAVVAGLRRRLPAAAEHALPGATVHRRTATRPAPGPRPAAPRAVGTRPAGSPPADGLAAQPPAAPAQAAPEADGGARNAQGAAAADTPADSGPSGQRAPLVVDVVVGGVGPAAGAARASGALTAAALRGEPYDLAVSAGIGGGFVPVAPLGTVVVADAIVAGDLGAETPDGFLPVTALGFGRSEHLPPAGLSRAVAGAAAASARGTAVRGTVLTVSTVTGSAARAAELLRRHPRAAAEAMEGFGVAEAAAAHGVPVLEIRAVSNAVGPRDRAAWRIGEALAALTDAFAALVPVLDDWEGPIS